MSKHGKKYNAAAEKIDRAGGYPDEPYFAPAELMAAYRDHEDLISVGAYRRGSNPKVDLAIAMQDAMLHYIRIAADGSVAQLEGIDIPNMVMMHDFNVTQNHVVFMDLPVCFDLGRCSFASMSSTDRQHRCDRRQHSWFPQGRIPG